MFFRGKRGDKDIEIKDDQEDLDFWKEVWQLPSAEEIAKKALSAANIWQQDLDEDNNAELVAGYISDMLNDGMRTALKRFLG